MPRRIRLGWIFVVGLLVAGSIRIGHAQTLQPRAAAEQRLPNVVVVMADDLGLGDIQPTNPACKIRTPALQSLADSGLTFLDAHTPSSVCTPTRYGLLTGRYNWRSRLAQGVLSGESEHLIPADRPTLGHLMRNAGYHTAMVGKWHLGWDWPRVDGEIDFEQPVLNGPDINGFDQYYGFSGSLDMPPYVWVDTGRVTAAPDRIEGVNRAQDPYGWYRSGPIGADFKIDEVLPHLFGKANSYIQAKAGQQQPFFLYLALPAPHTPIVPVPPFKDASGLNPYGDFVMQVDHHMGELLEVIREAGLEENTLVIFTSDNGCSPEANFGVLAEHGHDPSAGYRGHKADLFEGGHRVPVIARWPGHIEPGRSTTALACLTDIYSTLEAIVGQPRQATGGEDGFSWLPLFAGESTNGRTTLVSHSIGGLFAIRQGSWKLLLASGSGGWSQPTEPRAKQQGLPPLQLYNLDTDPAETTNLVDQHPDVVARLLRQLNQEVRQGRCTPGEPVSNDRNVRFLPEGVELPAEETSTPRALLETESLVYKVVDDRELQLHIEKPGDWQPNDRRPAIVFFFGGGWVGGTPNQFKPQSEFLAGHGMVGIRVEYRTIDRAGADPPVICCQDAKSAMRYVRSHAAELGIDPDRIVASGGSAGGHLAAFTSMVDGIDDPNDDTDVSPRANALVLFNPVFDNGPDQGWGHARVGERYREFSPAHNISADDPPAIVFLGDSDNLIPVVVLERFQERMRQAGVTCEARVYENAGHGFFNREPHLSQTLEATVEFLRAQRILD